MSCGKIKRTEHGGAKNSGASTGWYGWRIEAKEMSRRVRRQCDKREVHEQLREADEEPRWPS